MSSYDPVTMWLIDDFGGRLHLLISYHSDILDVANKYLVKLSFFPGRWVSSGVTMIIDDTEYMSVFENVLVDLRDSYEH